MRISEYAVRHPQLTIVMFLMAAALGVSALGTIPLSEDPVFPVSASTVVVRSLVSIGAAAAALSAGGGHFEPICRIDQRPSRRTHTTWSRPPAPRTLPFGARTCWRKAASCVAESPRTHVLSTRTDSASTW